MSEHTPGPWSAEDTVIYGPSHLNIAELEPNDYIRNDEQRANARLIAAAPDLLAALDALVDATNTRSLAYDDAVTAIAKARGQ